MEVHVSQVDRCARLLEVRRLAKRRRTQYSQLLRRARSVQAQPRRHRAVRRS